MVFPHKTRFCIDLLPGTTETYITVDGQEGLLLQVGDRVEVTGLEDAVCFVGLLRRSLAYERGGALSDRCIGGSGNRHRVLGSECLYKPMAE
jgi:hypothetical protein